MNPFKIKKGLGRGLSSLIGDSGISKSQTKISIGSIVKNKFQPRKIFNNDDLEELTNSIKERGVIQSIIVRKSEDYKNKYEIIGNGSKIAQFDTTEITFHEHVRGKFNGLFLWN